MAVRNFDEPSFVWAIAIVVIFRLGALLSKSSTTCSIEILFVGLTTYYGKYCPEFFLEGEFFLHNKIV